MEFCWVRKVTKKIQLSTEQVSLAVSTNTYEPKHTTSRKLILTVDNTNLLLLKPLRGEAILKETMKYQTVGVNLEVG